MSHRRKDMYLGPALAVALAAGLAFAATARAELPREAYLKMQRDAPELVRIDVVRVETVSRPGRAGTTVDVVATATVSRVERTACGLKPGARIRIVYQHHVHPPMPGASEIPIVECGKSYPAFLERCPQPAAFKPVAGGYSFDALQDERKVS